MWVKFWSISSTCLIVALNVNSYKSILKSITDRAANLTIKDLLTFAMDQGEYSGNVYAQSCCVYRVYTYMYIHRRLNESYLIEQWTLAHYSSRERLINESHKLSSACSALHDGETDGETMLLDRRTHVRIVVPLLCCCWLGSSYGPDRYPPPLVSTRAHSTSTYLLSISSNCHHVLTYRLFCVYISRIYLYPSKKVIDINTRPPCVSICSLPFALA